MEIRTRYNSSSNTKSAGTSDRAVQIAAQRFCNVVTCGMSSYCILVDKSVTNIRINLPMTSTTDTYKPLHTRNVINQTLGEYTKVLTCMRASKRERRAKRREPRILWQNSTCCPCAQRTLQTKGSGAQRMTCGKKIRAFKTDIRVHTWHRGGTGIGIIVHNPIIC